jgi:hypothetical protein
MMLMLPKKALTSAVRRQSHLKRNCLGDAPLASVDPLRQFFQLFYRRSQRLPEENEYKKKINYK